MRLFLDAHISARRIAGQLRAAGHDVRAADEERGLDGLGDEDLLALAASEQRILITCDVADFPRIVGRWAEEGRPHAGCAIIVGMDHGELGPIVQAVLAALAIRPDEEGWRDLTSFVSRPAPE